jgi:biopolymer transport protein ExbD
MSHSVSELNAEPNLTPILDMVFQLITFFMMVINFKTAAIDTSLNLPVIGSARPVEMPEADLLVLNVDKDGSLIFYGKAVKDVPAFISKEAQASRLAMRLRGDDDLPTTVVVRADKETRFSSLNRVLASCQENGYRNFSLKVVNPKDLRPGRDK